MSKKSKSIFFFIAFLGWILLGIELNSSMSKTPGDYLNYFNMLGIVVCIGAAFRSAIAAISTFFGGNEPGPFV